jgi:gliding motility-associated-like protein
MKDMNAMKFYSLPLFIALLGMQQIADAQVGPDGKKRYRVTGFKAANTSITSLSNTAEALPKATLYIPSAFTPNGDGINDKFGVKAQNITDFNLRIYNRWGELVFESDNISELWDGKYQGEAITSTDVFVYTVKAIGINGMPLPDENGTVTLVAEGVGDN